jgi:hypothetical protein
VFWEYDPAFGGSLVVKCAANVDNGWLFLRREKHANFLRNILE